MIFLFWPLVRILPVLLLRHPASKSQEVIGTFFWSQGAKKRNPATLRHLPTPQVRRPFDRRKNSFFGRNLEVLGLSTPL